MKEHFNKQSLIFYACAIGSVIVLFSIITAYGEKNLKAAHKINGNYLVSTQPLPGCLASRQWMLLIQQSGVFLTGGMLPVEANERTVQMTIDRPPMTGSWKNQQMTLTGQIDGVPDCKAQVKLQGAIAQNTFNGTLQLGVTAPTGISAKLEEVKPQEFEH